MNIVVFFNALLFLFMNITMFYFYFPNYNCIAAVSAQLKNIKGKVWYGNWYNFGNRVLKQEKKLENSVKCIYVRVRMLTAFSINVFKQNLNF